MKRTIQLKIWLNQNEAEAVAAGAQLHGLSRGEYVRRRITGRPVKEVNLLAKNQRALERQRLEEETEERTRLAQEAEEAERAAEVAARNAEWNAGSGSPARGRTARQGVWWRGSLVRDDE